MTIDQLRYAVEVHKHKSFNKAAESLYISQPSLSVSIRNLENELGEPLFIRSSIGTAPTSFGKEILPYIQKIVNLYEQMPLQIYGKAAKSCQRISIANGAFRFFSEVVGRLYAAHKEAGIHIEFHDVSMEESYRMVKDGSAQIGGFAIWSFQEESIEGSLNRAGIRFVRLGGCAPTVTIGPKNPLWERQEDWVTLDMIQSFPVIYSFSEHSNILLKQLGVYNRGNLITCRERAGRGELVSQTDGISIGGFPLQVYQKANNYPMQRVFHLHGFSFESNFGYIYNLANALSPLALEYVDLLNELV